MPDFSDEEFNQISLTVGPCAEPWFRASVGLRRDVGERPYSRRGAWMRPASSAWSASAIITAPTWSTDRRQHGRRGLVLQPGSVGSGGLARRRPYGFWSCGHLGNDRDKDLDPPFCSWGLQEGTNGSAVYHLDVAITRGSDGILHPVPPAFFAPSHEAIVAGGSCAVTFG